MPRKARVPVIDAPHHIYLRAPVRRVLFYSDKDRRAYLEILADQARKCKLDILAYCLMRDHVNLVAIPRRRNALANAVGRTSFSYTNYINNRRNRDSQVWRGRFQSCALDGKYLKIAVRNVECQPVYEGLVRKPEKYRWSSASAHISGKDQFDILAMDVWPPKRTIKNWADLLAGNLSVDVREKLRTYTQTGRPLGGREFIEPLEKKFRRRLHPLPVGRPRKDT